MKRYTKEEDKIILDFVKQYPENLTKAFNLSEKKLKDRTQNAICQHYYHSLANSSQIILTLFSEKKIIKNRKCPKNSDRTTSNKPSIWKKLLSLLSK